LAADRGLEQLSATLAVAFTDSYGQYADAVSAGTGIDRTALLIQWAVETNYGQQINNANNLGNIRCGPDSFCQYASPSQFAGAAIFVWHNGFYPDVLAAAGMSLDVQLLAIGSSPWDAGHYDNGGGPGSSLLAIKSEFGGADNDMTPEQDNTLHAIQTIVGRIETLLNAVNTLLNAVNVSTLGRIEGKEDVLIKDVTTPEPPELFSGIVNPSPVVPPPLPPPVPGS
jgi:hypothetical protein